MAPTGDDLQQIAEQVWASYLDTDGEKPLVPVAPGKLSKEIVAGVAVSGAWHGLVLVACSSVASREAAAALLGMDAAEVTDGDVDDALGELANVIGGNVKSLLPEPCVLGLPEVHADAEGDPWLEGDEICRFEATWLGEPMEVSVLEKPPGQGEDAE
jgi:chemotaxis protein CheX